MGNFPQVRNPRISKAQDARHHRASHSKFRVCGTDTSHSKLTARGRTWGITPTYSTTQMDIKAAISH